MIEAHKEEVWTKNHENIWYSAYVTRHDEYCWLAKLEGARSGDERYRVYVHSTTVQDHFGLAVVGTKIKVRITPNRKRNGGLAWEALEAVIDSKDCTAEAEEKQ
jgi:hypothetical protein